MANLSYMFLLSLLSFGLIGSAIAQSCPKVDKVVFCYYQSWSVYRPSFGAFNISIHMDPDLCTHYVYSFAGLGLDGTTISLDAYNDLPESGALQQYYYFRSMKESNPCIKVLLSIGGWNEGSEKYSVMAERAESREKFVEHLLRFLIYYGFDGVDLDWEYPSQRGGIPADRANHVILLREMKARFAPRNKLVSIAVGAADELTNSAYDVKAISGIVDYVLMMTYDYQKADTTTYMAPLRRNGGDIYNSGSVSESVQKWLSLGCPASKLVVGIQTSGRSYTLESPNSNPSLNSIGKKASGPGVKGPYTNIDGVFAYFEICDMLAEDDTWHVVSNDGIYASSYATKGDQWIAYEDKETVLAKSKYVVEQKLAGVMIWSLDTDDFRRFCEDNTYALTRSARSGLGLK